MHTSRLSRCTQFFFFRSTLPSCTSTYFSSRRCVYVCLQCSGQPLSISPKLPLHLSPWRRLSWTTIVGVVVAVVEIKRCHSHCHFCWYCLCHETYFFLSSVLFNEGRRRCRDRTFDRTHIRSRVDTCTRTFMAYKLHVCTSAWPENSKTRWWLLWWW